MQAPTLFPELDASLNVATIARMQEHLKACPDYNISIGLHKNRRGEEYFIAMYWLKTSKGVPRTETIQSKSFSGVLEELNRRIFALKP